MISIDTELIVVTVATAISTILGFLVFFGNSRKTANRLFLGLSLSISAWSFVNYLAVQELNPETALWLIRTVLLLAVAISAFFFALSVNLYRRGRGITHLQKTIFLLVTAFVALATLSPLVFSGLESGAAPLQPLPAPGAAIFAVYATLLPIISVILLILAAWRARAERQVLVILAVSSALMFTLILTFNFYFIVLLQDTQYVYLGPVFTLPFFSIVAFAMSRHSFLVAKMKASELLFFVAVLVALVSTALILGAQSSETALATLVILLLLGVLVTKLVHSEIRKRKNLEALAKKLNKLNQNLTALESMRSGSATTAPHQLRSPLTVIKGYVSFLQEGIDNATNGSGQEALSKIFASTDRLDRLVSDLLNLSHLESGEVKYTFEQGDIREVIKESVEACQEEANSRGIEIRIMRSSSEVPPVTFDRNKIREVLVNLIENALKYSDKGSVIKITTNVDANRRVRVEVSDNGIGIPEKYLGKLFTKFFRTDNAKASDPEGLGIGLYFVKKVIQAHKGAVCATSTGLGKGSVFSFSLPIVKAVELT